VIDKIEKIVKEDDSHENNGLLNFFHPMPKELEGTTSPSSSSKKPQPMIEGFDCWYDWRCHNWSTKWEVCEFYGVDRQYLKEQNEGESTISFGFSSAWAPPINAYENFLENNSNCFIRAYYYEGGCDFMGLWEDGIDDCYAPSDYKSTDDFWQDGIGSTLDEMFNITESMAEYEAEQEAEKEDVHEYVKGKAINIGEEV
tara:strand:+ start:333 stop:929 length:597 start_codon:yes stop_codon:yes gene_type:complete